MSRHAFTLTPMEAQALLRVVDESMARVVRASVVPPQERLALARVRRALIKLTNSPSKEWKSAGSCEHKQFAETRPTNERRA